MLNSKFVKKLSQSKKSKECVLHVKGDWNDSDYIHEETTWEVDEMNDALPYFSILVDLYAFDKDYRKRTHDYEIDIRDDMISALKRYFKREKGFYPELLALKSAGKVFSEKVLALSDKEFKELYNKTVTELLENIEDTCCYSLPNSDYGDSIHTIEKMYIEYQGNKYNVESGKVVEALAELMDRMCK